MEPLEPLESWTRATRVAFRFCFAYFGLYSLATQIAGGLLLTPRFSFPSLGVLWPMREITLWSATHVFGITAGLEYAGNSGDTAFYWVQTCWLLVVAVVVTGIWSDLDRKGERDVALYTWFRLFVRLALASQMLYYGMVKVIPTQFPAPSLITLVEPVGALSVTGLLWTSIGGSQWYQIFTGCAELLAGFLLLVPRTALLGALVCLADMTQVFVLNLTYDIGLKQFAFHLILMTMFLLAPDLERLANLFFRDCAVSAPTEPALWRTHRADRLALSAQILFGIYLLGMFTYISQSRWYAEGGGSPRSPLYGIWNVEQLSVDGQLRSPADSTSSDYDRRWRRVIFDTPGDMAFQRTDDSFAHYGISVDTASGVIALTRGTTWNARFTFDRPAPDRLILDGDMDGHRIHVRLQLVGLDTLRLLNSGFRWIRPPDPFGG